MIWLYTYLILVSKTWLILVYHYHINQKCMDCYRTTFHIFVTYYLSISLNKLVKLLSFYYVHRFFHYLIVICLCSIFFQELLDKMNKVLFLFWNRNRHETNIIIFLSKVYYICLRTFIQEVVCLICQYENYQYLLNIFKHLVIKPMMILDILIFSILLE